jgi:hypothetical protein
MKLEVETEELLPSNIKISAITWNLFGAIP